MIIPFSTDAPIYHYPRATLGMIAANVAVHVWWSYVPPETAKPFVMVLGEGLHPMQWLTHNFFHADFLHLGFNMLFLWVYGIIVEGKIGWFPFLLTYLAIGTIHGAAIQAAYLNAADPSYVLGASAIVFGLMAIDMVWAPVNELTCFYLFFVGFRIITGDFELKIYAFALLQIFLESASMTLQYVVRGDPMSSGLLHISGAFWGLIAGVALVQSRLVDCEGWDIFSLWRKDRALSKAWKAREARHDRARELEKRPKPTAEEDRPGLNTEERAAKLLARLRRSIGVGDSTSIDADYRKWMAAAADRPSRDALLGVIQALHGRKAWKDSIPAMRALCRLYPDRADKVRLKLAFLLLQPPDERPTEARRHLEKIAEKHLTPEHRQMRQNLLSDADRLIEEGVLEVEEEI